MKQSLTLKNCEINETRQRPRQQRKSKNKLHARIAEESSTCLDSIWNFLKTTFKQQRRSSHLAPPEMTPDFWNMVPSREMVFLLSWPLKASFLASPTLSHTRALPHAKRRARCWNRYCRKRENADLVSYVPTKIVVVQFPRMSWLTNLKR